MIRKDQVQYKYLMNKFFKNWNTGIHQLIIYKCLKQKVEGNKLYNFFMGWNKYTQNKLQERENIFKTIKLTNLLIKKRAFIDWCMAIQAQYLVIQYIK